MTVAIKNVGPGAAFEIDVKLLFDPMAGGHVAHEQRWRQNVLASGEQRDFLPPGDLSNNLNSLPETYRNIRLIGSMSDASRNAHTVDEGFPDLAGWREALGEARQRFIAADPERRLADALGKKIEQPAKGLEAKLDRIARALEELGRPASDDDLDNS